MLALPQAALAQRAAYWLTKPGTTHLAACPGKSGGEPLKIGRDLVRGSEREAADDDRWFHVSGLVTCSDAGADYVYAVEFLHVGVNPAERPNLERDTFIFDWVGLAAYRGAAENRAIEWLYDEAMPIRGTLKRDATARITFGDVSFRIPKRLMASATHFTFYITAEGLLWHVPVL